MTFSESLKLQDPKIKEESWEAIAKALRKMAERKFDYEVSPNCASPSENYFWYRKGQEVIKLCTRNLHHFLKSTNTSTTSRLICLYRVKES